MYIRTDCDHLRKLFSLRWIVVIWIEWEWELDVDNFELEPTVMEGIDLEISSMVSELGISPQSMSYNSN